MQLQQQAPPTTRVVPHGWQPAVTAGDLLAQPAPVVVPRDWWSWAGAHGGLLVALAAADAASVAPEAALRSSTAQLLRPVRGPLVLRSALVHAGRRITTVRTEGTVDGRTALVVHSTFGAPNDARTAGADPLPVPLVHRPEDLEPFVPPAELVPFGRHVDIRPTDGVLPLTGGPTARLSAWVRLREEDGAPGPLRTTVLADALAPSLYATLRVPTAVPTVELAVHHRSPAPVDSDDPWLLVRARTDWSDEGWVSEAVDLWDRAGTHVATSRQLRLVS
ncbi:thioesterase family protein [Iamia sp. SCSIO 61187]|uniref:thioesterase family protein n=1 Tax=Iamia sp. SCSIO 61187 TaxID=2722752 RepID=UPI001C625456|nr:thioesterase family protein [Iamia sp. SCSIO 61187]QYG91083.1 thioesterase family protein [Iamia sp. SCSIO 61187]